MTIKFEPGEIIKTKFDRDLFYTKPFPNMLMTTRYSVSKNTILTIIRKEQYGDHTTFQITFIGPNNLILYKLIRLAKERRFYDKISVDT